MQSHIIVDHLIGAGLGIIGVLLGMLYVRVFYGKQES